MHCGGVTLTELVPLNDSSNYLFNQKSCFCRENVEPKIVALLTKSFFFSLLD